MTRNSWLRTGALIGSLLAGGCHGPMGTLAGQASDEWVRSYELRPDGEIQVSVANGSIDLEGYDGQTVEVRAERSARAVTDEAARDLVSKIAIDEEVSPDRVAIRTEGISGLLIGVSYQVKYYVRAPHSVVARMRVTNGVVSAKHFSGHLIATTTNGGIVGEELGGKLEGRSTNGTVRIALREVAPAGVSLRTTNGRVDLSLPGVGEGRPLRGVPQRRRLGRRAHDRATRRAVAPRGPRQAERRRRADRRGDDERHGPHSLAVPRTVNEAQ